MTQAENKIMEIYIYISCELKQKQQQWLYQYKKKNSKKIRKNNKIGAITIDHVAIKW